MSAHTTLNQTDNLSTCHVPVSRIGTIINLFEAYKSKGSLTKRDWDILSALERIFTNGEGIKFMQLSVADVALSYDAFKRIKELGVKRNKDHWLFFEDSEGRNTMDLAALESIANSNCRMFNKNSNDLGNHVRYFAEFRKTRIVEVYPKEVSKDRRRNILKYFDSGPHYMPNDNSGNEIEYFALDTSTGRQVRLHPDDITGVILPLFLALSIEEFATNTSGELSEPENSTQFKPMCLRSGRKLPMPDLTGCGGQDHAVHVNNDEQPAIDDSIKPNRQDEASVAAARNTHKGPAGDSVVVAQGNDDEYSSQNKPSFYEIGSDSGSNDDDCYEANDRKGRSKNVDSSSNSVLSINIVHGMVLELSKTTFTREEILQELTKRGWKGITMNKIGQKLNKLECCKYKGRKNNGFGWTHDPTRCSKVSTGARIHYAISMRGPLILRDLVKLLEKNQSTAFAQQIQSFSCCKRDNFTFSHTLPCGVPQASIPLEFVEKVKRYKKVESRLKKKTKPDVVSRILNYKKQGYNYGKISEKLNSEFPDLDITDEQVMRRCYRKTSGSEQKKKLLEKKERNSKRNKTA